MKIISALALAVFTSALLASACAQTIKPVRMTPSVAATKLAQPHMLRHVKMPPPNVFTRQETAARIAKALKLTVPPMVGAPISLTPSKLAIPGLAYLNLQEVGFVDGAEEDEIDSPKPTGVAGFSRSSVAAAKLSFRTMPGKRYAIDCRFETPRLYYDIQVASDWQKGSLDSDGSKHFLLFVTQPATSNDWQLVILHFTESDDQPASNLSRYFWGCEISPF